jgi:cytochrome bd-type quinol oxidase subunit 2
MWTLLRWSLASVLLLILAACVYLSVAVREAPPESRWAFWYIYALIGVACCSGVGWLVWPRKT